MQHNMLLQRVKDKWTQTSIYVNLGSMLHPFYTKVSTPGSEKHPLPAFKSAVDGHCNTLHTTPKVVLNLSNSVAQDKTTPQETSTSCSSI